MHKVVISHSGRRLNITLAGRFDLQSAYRCIDDVTGMIPKLRAPFDVICDIHAIEPVTTNVAQTIKLATRKLEEYGVKNIIRVVGSSKYALTIFARFACVTTKAKIHFVPTIADAEKLLDEIRIIEAIDNSQVLEER